MQILELVQLERQLLEKLAELTRQNKLSWQFKGVSRKICFALYRDTELNLYAKKLEIIDNQGYTAIIDAFVAPLLEKELEKLSKLARQSAGRYPTCEITLNSSNVIDLYQKLLQD
jgi:hypothetical protein